MSFPLDPRGDLPPPMFQPIAYMHTHRSPSTTVPKHNNRRLSALSLSTKTRLRPCYDWIFSSASNVHVALDKSAFKHYTPFESYVLALSDYRHVSVKGIGTVELKIRRKPDSRETHTILLTGVLHVPSWLCNLFSDVHFDSGRDFEHQWTTSGVQFSKNESGQLRPWGYTETFCSLDRLVLGKHHKDSRSPMLEDGDREVFSINVVWPQSQRDRWETYQSQCEDKRLSRTLSVPTKKLVKSPRNESIMFESQATTIGTKPRRATLSNMNINIVNQAPSARLSSLKATISGRNLSTQVV